MSATLSAAEACALVGARERFGVRLGLDRMLSLLAELGHPQRRYPAIHVVGTNGKSTVARKIEALLQANGQRTGTYLSPHVTSFAERFRVDGEELQIETVLEPVLEAVAIVDRTASEPVTQFELLTVAALNAFATEGVDVAVVEAGLGGRHDATNVLSADVVVLTNVALDHEQQLGTRRSEIAEEKLAVISPGATVVLGEPEWRSRALGLGATRVLSAGTADAQALAATAAHLGHSVDGSPAAAISLPGRCEQIAEYPCEIWDGAHNPHAVAWLASRLGPAEHVLVLSILEDKDVEEMLDAFADIGSTLVATASTNARALPARELMEIADNLNRFALVEALEDPLAARARGRALAQASNVGLVVSGSLYLLCDLAAVRPRHVP